jgi:glycosyltransferase involved in cell wall biosynthesis
MKIALCSSFVPFIKGGARFIVEWLEQNLKAWGHDVERIYLPQVDVPELIFQQIAAYRWIDLTESADRIICIRPPAHHIPHPNKILWFIHHIRYFYDLWGTSYCPIPDNAKWQGVRQALFEADTVAMKEAKHVYTNSQTVANRLKQFNGIDSEVLYPPILNPSAFRYEAQNDEVVYICRIEPHKRQHLLVEAMKYTDTPVKLRLCGTSSGGYSQCLTDFMCLNDLSTGNHSEDRVIFENRWISEEEKVNLLATCLAAAYVPLDEDSYGYSSLEASHASKPIITTTDSGGVTELVKDSLNGFVCEPTPQALADAMDRLYLDRKLAKQMGENAHSRISELRIEWPHVIERLLS